MKTMTAMGWVAKGALIALGACSVQTELGGDPGGGGGERHHVDSDQSTGGVASTGGRSQGGEGGAPLTTETGGVPQIGGSGSEGATGGVAASGGAAHTGGGDQGTGGLGSGGGDNAGGAMPCQEERWYRDADGDGFGDPEDWVNACLKPSGYVGNADDCYDGNAMAKPTQAAWFTEDRGDGSFDYDCSGSTDFRYPDFAQCPDFDANGDHACPPANLWPAGYSISFCRPDPAHPQCYCDYYGMSDRFESAKDGWRPLLKYEQCPDGLCPVYQELPACGADGVWNVSITWSTDDEAWQCRDTGSIGATQRVQSCR